MLQCRPACTAAYAKVCAVEYAVALRWWRDENQVAACLCSHAPSTSLARFVASIPSRAANAIPAKRPTHGLGRKSSTDLGRGLDGGEKCVKPALLGRQALAAASRLW